MIHKKQLKEGNFDCFGKAGAYCDQSTCKYKQWCIRMEEVEKAQREDEGTTPIRTRAHS